jgi:hypothetical protein
MIEQDRVSRHRMRYPGFAADIALDSIVGARLVFSLLAWNIPHRLVRARHQLE